MKTKTLLLFNLCVILAFHDGFAQNSRIRASYYGGLGNDGGFSVATDPSGNVYMAGITMSQNGIASGGFQNAFGGGVVDAYLAKFDSAGNRLWATYYGGPGDEMAFFGGKMGVATDVFGNVFLAGFTSSATGIASGGFQNSLGGTAVNAYLVKFDPAGNRLWATYYGGTSADKAYSVATDDAGNVYIAGIAGSAGLASGGFQNTIGGSSDALLVKFDTNGNRIWSTYYGGTGTEEGFSVVVDQALNVYLAGTTNSTTGIASGGAQNGYGGGSNDLFLVKFDSAGARLWATYYGGSADEMFLFAGDLDLAADPDGNVYLTGMTSSTNNISLNGFQNSFGGGTCDAFLAKFDASGARQWGTYYGGTGLDKGYGAATNALGNIYLAGRTDSQNAIASAGFDTTFNGPLDAFLVKFNPDGTRLCATYFGATDMDECNSVAVDAADHVYLGGNTANMSGISWNGFQNVFGGGQADAFLVKFTSCLSTVTVEEFHDRHHLIYPNPSEGDIYISGTNGMNGSVSIYNSLGSEVPAPVIVYGENQIQISGLRNGFYCIKIFDGKYIQAEKILIR